ncbi:hypothetical protein pb186bvf_004384 [Paramecium bursaria]
MNQKELDNIQASILIRCNQLLDQCPRSKRALYTYFIDRMKRKLQILLNLDDPIPPLTRSFLGHLIIKKVKYFNYDPCRDIILAETKLSIAFHQHPIIYQFNDGEALSKARETLKQNKTKLSIICKRKVTNNMIDRYFLKSKFYTFEQIYLNLDGLSSYHGQTTFIDKQVNDLQGTIIHEFAHNFPRFLMEKKKPRYISPKKNERLRYWDEQNGKLQQIEAGDFIENRIFGTAIISPNPFGLKYKI